MNFTIGVELSNAMAWAGCGLLAVFAALSVAKVVLEWKVFALQRKRRR